jgi:hypothetical protein
MKTQPSKELAPSKKPLTPQLKQQVSIGDWINNDNQTKLNTEIYNAKTQTKISEFTENSQVNELLKEVTTWRLHLGIREDASKEEFMLLTNFIRENYGTMSIGDIKLAYKYALTGKLGIDGEAYGKFSPLYVSKILNAYAVYTNRIYANLKYLKKEWETKQLKMAKEKEEQDRIANMSFEEKVENRKKSIVWYYHQIRNSYKYIGDYGGVVWTFLTRNNIITANNIDFDTAREEAKKMRIAHTLSVFDKVLEKMTTEERQKEYDQLDEMYGKFFVMQQFFRTIDNIDKWLSKFSNEQIIPRKNEKTNP